MTAQSEMGEAAGTGAPAGRRGETAFKTHPRWPEVRRQKKSYQRIKFQSSEASAPDGKLMSDVRHKSSACMFKRFNRLTATLTKNMDF